MTDAPAAPEDRYVAVRFGSLVGAKTYGVVDRVIGEIITYRFTYRFPTRDAARSEAQRLNREARAANKPVAEPSAPEDRYTVGIHGVSGCYVVDRVLEKRVSPPRLTWDAARYEAQRLNREARAANKPVAEPSAPSGNCAAKLKVAEDKAERFRIALNKIARYGDEYSRRAADDALFAAPQLAKEE